MLTYIAYMYYFPHLCYMMKYARHFFISSAIDLLLAGRSHGAPFSQDFYMASRISVIRL